MGTFLDDLLADARRRVDGARTREPTRALRDRAAASPVPPSFSRALRQPGVQVIAEVKRASPSRGDLAPELDAVAHARDYADGGAAAISVLTEPSRFKGSLTDLAGVAALGVPTLRKDFVVDPHQVWEARAAGAAAVLLIVAALDDATLRHLQQATRDADLEALVEVHDERELERAVAAGASLIGINARDLRTFEVDRGGFSRLRRAVPAGVVTVAESGVQGPQDVRRVAAQGADAVLVGESLMTSPDPRRSVASLVAAGQEVTA